MTEVPAEYRTYIKVELVRAIDQIAELPGEYPEYLTNLCNALRGMIRYYDEDVEIIPCPECGMDQEYIDHRYSNEYTEYCEYYECADDCDGPPMKATFRLVEIGEAE